jgi:hypothetical protein
MGPPQLRQQADLNFAHMPAEISGGNSALQAELRQVSARMDMLHSVISTAVDSDPVRQLAPLLGDVPSADAELALHGLLQKLAQLPGGDPRCQPFKQLIERHINLVNRQVTLHFQFSKVLAGVLPLFAEGGNLIDRVAECVF